MSSNNYASGETPMMDSLADQFRKVVEAEAHHRDTLNGIRADLMVNFGDTPINIYGFILRSELTVRDMVLEVLRQLTKKTATIPFLDGSGVFHEEKQVSQDQPQQQPSHE